MVRVLIIIAVAGFILAIGCFAGAMALGGPQLLEHGWSIPGDRLVSWSADGGDRSDGQVVTRDLVWSGGDTLEVDLPAKVTFTQSDHAAVAVTGPADLVARVAIDNGRLLLTGEGDDQTLTIDRHGVRLLDDVDRLSITVSAPKVSRFILNGSRDLRIEGYDQDELFLTVNGGGDVAASGRAGALTLAVAGSGDADLGELVVQDAAVDVAGSGDVRLSPRGVAHVQIAGGGDVTLLTRPASLTSSTAGSGRIHDAF